MNQTAYERIIQALEHRGSQIRPQHGYVMAQCPAHDDNNPSLTVGQGHESALVYCHAGCDTDAVLAALDLRLVDLYDNPREQRYEYRDLEGILNRTVIRKTDTKGFYQTGAKESPILYRLEDVQAAVAKGEPVYLVEGEKDANNVRIVAEVTATTAPMGAGNFNKVDVSPLAGATVIAIVDKDLEGDKWANQVATKLEGVAKSVTFMQALTGKDASDHLAAYWTLDNLTPYQGEIGPQERVNALDTLLVGDGEEDPDHAAYLFAKDVAAEARKIRIREAAREHLALEKTNALDIPTLKRLDSFLAEPDEEAAFMIDRVWPTGGSVVLAAQQKAGKSTLVGNLVRALADGTPFLNKYDTQQQARIVLLDDELNEGTLRRWLRDQGIEHTDRIELVALRGHLSKFNLLEESTRERWAQIIGPADVLILDCLRPVLDALGLDENRDAGRFLEALDELTAAAGIPQVLVVHHMGHSGERSRGDSRILDWPYANWSLVKDEQEDDQAAGDVHRYFKAYGRDVDEPQQRLGFDPETRHLSIVGGSRTLTRAEVALTDVLDLVQRQPGLSGREIEDKLKESEHSQKAIRDALKYGIAREQIRTQEGPRRAKLHYAITLDLEGLAV